MGRHAHNKLLETFKEEYRRTGRMNTTCGRINAWYTDLSNTSGPYWLAKMGEIKLSREFPVLNYRYKTAQLFQLPDGKWRMTVSCDIPEDKPPVTEPTAIGMDGNVGNAATPDYTIMVPEKVTHRMINTQRTDSKT